MGPTHPDESGDWLNMRSSAFSALTQLSRDAVSFFDTDSMGVGADRDAWCYNFEVPARSRGMHRMISTYNSEARRGSPILRARRRPSQDKLVV